MLLASKIVVGAEGVTVGVVTGVASGFKQV
jgi:hypothetical protein